MKESQPSSLTIHFPEQVDPSCNALQGGFFVDPKNPNSPRLLSRFAKNPKILKEMTAPTEEHSDN